METLGMKKCRQCQMDRNSDNFHRYSKSDDGLYPLCKSCVKIVNAEYYARNREKRLADHKLWFSENKDKVKQYGRDNADRDNENRRKRRIITRDHSNKLHREYQSKRRQTDVQFKLRKALRSRVNNAIKGGAKRGSAVNDLGCTIDYLKKYLESQFTEGMSWENWSNGEGKWNIDHIMPLTAFDLTNRQHFLLANHFGNLRPLWHNENMSKHNKIPEVS